MTMCRRVRRIPNSFAGVPWIALESFSPASCVILGVAVCPSASALPSRPNFSRCGTLRPIIVLRKADGPWSRPMRNARNSSGRRRATSTWRGSDAEIRDADRDLFAEPSDDETPPTVPRDALLASAPSPRNAEHRMRPRTLRTRRRPRLGIPRKVNERPGPLRWAAPSDYQGRSSLPQ